MTEPSGVGTPGTDAAWEALMSEFRFLRDQTAIDLVTRYRLAIEAEATRAERERIVRAVEGLPRYTDEEGIPELSERGGYIWRERVLAILRDTP